MALFIESTDSNWPSYAPGDLVCGVVRLHAKSDHEPCESLYITLEGQISVSLKRPHDGFVNHQSSSHLSSQAFLIKRTILLVSATDLQPAGNHCWPFSFKLPLFTDSGTGYDSAHPGHCFEATSPWKGSVDTEHHPLAPSMRCLIHSGMLCTVDYILAARLVRPPASLALSLQNLCNTQQLKIRSQNINTNIGTGGILQSIELNSIITHRCNRLRSFLRPLCSQNQPPVSSVTGRVHLEIRLPTTINLRDTAPIPITVQTVYIGRDHCVNEQLEIRRLSIQLKACTMVRVGEEHQSRTATMPLYEGQFILPLKHDTSYSYSHDKFWPGQDSPARFTTTQDMDLETRIGRAVREALHKHEIVPEFASYNIFRAYSLQLTVRLRLCHRTITFNRDRIPLSLPMSAASETYERAPSYETITATNCTASSLDSQTFPGDGSFSPLDTQSQDSGNCLPPYERRRRVFL